jgi:eukaryotic-like serine/threonine-protein kinase
VVIETGVLPARYTGVRPIGRGGMGEIYLAEDRELGRKVAVKVLNDQFARDEQLRRRFRREALTAACLSGHRHVVTIYDVGEWEGRPFIVMEYLPGGTLAERARSGAVEHHQALEWLAQAAVALDDAHELGIIHRDVKPANLLFDGRGEIAVGDFGIARAVDDTTGMTAAGTVLGTAGYLAPEQALGQAATPASDRYALGVVAYELLTGGRPFERSSTTAEAAAHIHEPVPPASERGVGVPGSVDRVFEQVLAKDPADRYPTASAFVKDLGEALRATAVTRPLPIAPPPTAQPPPEPARPTRGSRTPWFALALAGLLLALVGGAAAAILTTGGEDDPAAPTQRADQVTVTKKETRTAEGETVTETVVTTVETTPATNSVPAAGAISIDEAVALTDQSTYALQRGDWTEAAQLARRAYKPLEGTYSDEFRYEAYVNYDLGKALAELGRCQRALVYLDRSEELQGSRGEIDEARATCEDGE